MHIIWTKHASRNSQRKIQNISRGIEKGLRKILDLKPFSFSLCKYLFKDMRTTPMMMKSSGVKRCCSLCDLHAGLLNPCSTNVPLPYPLKTENWRFLYVFRGYRSGTLVENGLSLERKSPKYCLNILVRQYMKLLSKKNSQIFWENYMPL